MDRIVVQRRYRHSRRRFGSYTRHSYDSFPPLRARRRRRDGRTAPSDSTHRCAHPTGPYVPAGGTPTPSATPPAPMYRRRQCVGRRPDALSSTPTPENFASCTKEEAEGGERGKESARAHRRRVSSPTPTRAKPLGPTPTVGRRVGR